MSQPAFSDHRPTDGVVEYHGSSHSSTRLVLILIIGLFVILLVWALQPAKRFGQGEFHPSVGRAMGSFQLTPLVGDTAPVTLESIRGDVVLINFWGTWCGPCLMELPHLIEMNDRLKGHERFRFVPVSCGPGAEIDAERLQAETQSYLASREIDLNVYSDPGTGARQSLVKAAQLPGFGFPTTVLLDRDGTIRALWEGYRQGAETEMEEAIKDLLKS